MTARDSKIADHLRSRASEFMDGFVIIGFIAGSETPVVIADAKDARTAFALNYAKDNFLISPQIHEPEAE